MAKIKQEVIPFHVVIKKALDGRTNRWLSIKTGIAESDMSRILNGRLIPTDAQIESIKSAFPFDLHLSK